ncbi:MAG: serine hydroxymethyltransferase [Bacilli bacterium]|nr:serine hydroxymethyltransferase [Bacilli bacterium]
MMNKKKLQEVDPELYQQIQNELNRQRDNIELIASENYVSLAVLEAQGSVLTNKYAEGYPGRRYYGGCEFIDNAERLAIDRVCKLFNVKYANVQAHSGSSANMAVYKALVPNGGTVLGMSLDAGGHLTHGYKLSFSGKDFNAKFYGVNDQGYIDYDEVRRIALECKPKMIIAGASAYSRIIDFKKFRAICDEVGAYLFVDMAHIAGLIAAGLHPNPCEVADVVSSTTHKTLRGPRGGIILTNNEEIIKKINSSIFPGCQGGPLEHVIAAKAVAFHEALQPEFKTYQQQIVKNAKAMVDEFIKMGYEVVSGGTDNHLFTLVITKLGINGLEAETLLHKNNITLNKNAIPRDPLPPFKASGLRIGTPAMTTRGFKEDDVREVARLIDTILKHRDDEVALKAARADIKKLLDKYPLPY